MKKIICVLLIALLCLTLAACGSDSGATADSSSASDSTQTAAEEFSTVAPENTFASVKDYLDDPKVSGKIKEGMDDDSTVSMEVYADDDTLVYSYKYKDHIAQEQVPVVKGNLDSALDANTDTYQNVINELKMYVRIDAPKVKVVFLNDDDSEITSKTFE